jgi:hypothetical protein
MKTKLSERIQYALEHEENWQVDDPKALVTEVRALEDQLAEAREDAAYWRNMHAHDAGALAVKLKTAHKLLDDAHNILAATLVREQELIEERDAWRALVESLP